MVILPPVTLEEHPVPGAPKRPEVEDPTRGEVDPTACETQRGAVESKESSQVEAILFL